jgi:type III restriction enzyme
MALHPDFPRSPYEPLLPEFRWFPAAENLRAIAYDKLLPPLVAKVSATNRNGKLTAGGVPEW